MQDLGRRRGGRGFHQRACHRERALHRRVVEPAQLETADPVDARLAQGQVELVVVAGHRLHRADQVPVRVIEAEAVVDVDRGDVETDLRRRPGRGPGRATRRTGRRSPSRPSARPRRRSRRADRTARSRPRARRSRAGGRASACATSSRPGAPARTRRSEPACTPITTNAHGEQQREHRKDRADRDLRIAVVETHHLVEHAHRYRPPP